MLASMASSCATPLGIQNAECDRSADLSAHNDAPGRASFQKYTMVSAEKQVERNPTTGIMVPVES